jgi:hypothetical protein
MLVLAPLWVVAVLSILAPVFFVLFACVADALHLADTLGLTSPERAALVRMNDAKDDLDDCLQGGGDCDESRADYREAAAYYKLHH